MASSNPALKEATTGATHKVHNEQVGTEDGLPVIEQYVRSTTIEAAIASLQAAPYFRPTVKIIDDTRPYWPGETVSLQGTDGPSLAPSPMPITRISGTIENGLLKLSIEPFKKQPKRRRVRDWHRRRENEGGRRRSRYGIPRRQTDGDG